MLETGDKMLPHPVGKTGTYATSIEKCSQVSVSSITCILHDMHILYYTLYIVKYVFT